MMPAEASARATANAAGCSPGAPCCWAARRPCCCRRWPAGSTSSRSSRPQRFATLAEENRINLRLLPPSRGLIFDRTGQPLAVNRNNFRAMATSDRGRGADVLVERLDQILSLGETETEPPAARAAAQPQRPARRGARESRLGGGGAARVQRARPARRVHRSRPVARLSRRRADEPHRRLHRPRRRRGSRRPRRSGAAARDHALRQEGRGALARGRPARPRRRRPGRGQRRRPRRARARPHRGPARRQRAAHHRSRPAALRRREA